MVDEGKKGLYLLKSIPKVLMVFNVIETLNSSNVEMDDTAMLAFKF
jgi:hypothetical protein